MEFDETPRFWYPHVALTVWMNFSFSPDENLRSDFHRSKKEAKKEIKNKIKFSLSLSLHAPLPFCLTFLLSFFFNINILLLFLIHGSYCFIRVCLCPETIYFFSVHFILNELSLSHFLTSEILVKISSLKSLTAYHPENYKIFRLSQNSTKLF